jgi:hypothetical protein
MKNICGGFDKQINLELIEVQNEGRNDPIKRIVDY